MNVDKLRAALAVLKLAERGTDNGWVDDDAVERARVAVLRESRALVQRLDAAEPPARAWGTDPARIEMGPEWQFAEPPPAKEQPPRTRHAKGCGCPDCDPIRPSEYLSI